MSKIFIDGHAGRLGTQLLKVLSNDIYLSSYDLTNHKQVKEEIERIKPDIVFHLAGKITGSQSELMKVNYKGTLNLYNVCQDNKVKKFIFTSSAAVYHQTELKPTREDENVDPKNYYGQSKLYGELPLTKAVILRIFNIYGRTFDTSLVNKLYYSTEDKRVPITIPALYFRDYVYIDDVVTALIKAQGAKDGIYNLCSGKLTSTQELVETIPSHWTLEESDLETSISWGDNEKLGKEINFLPRRNICLW